MPANYILYVERLMSLLDWRNIQGELCGAVLLMAVEADSIILRCLGPLGK